MSLASRRRRHLIKTCASCVAAGDLRPPFVTSCTLAAGENLTMTGAGEVIHHEVAVQVVDGGTSSLHAKLKLEL
jgi:hypothetical protein